MATMISYTVKSVQREDTFYADGDLCLPVGTVIFLAYVDEGGGWPQWGESCPASTPWDTPEEALEEARASDGMPWWNKPDMDTIKVVKLTASKEFKAEEI